MNGDTDAEGEGGNSAQRHQGQDSSPSTEQSEERHDQSSQDAPQQQHGVVGNIVQEEVQYESNSEEREVTRREYRRRMTLDPLVDLFGDGLFDDADDNNDGSGEANNNHHAQEENEEDVHVHVHMNLEAAPANNNNDAHAAIEEHRRINSELRLMGQLLGRFGGDDSESSDGEDENNENGSNHMDDSNREPLQPARNHSYLPTAQPLYPEEWIPAGQHRPRLSRSSDELEEEVPDGDINEDSEDVQGRENSERDEQLHSSLHTRSAEMECDIPVEELGASSTHSEESLNGLTTLAVLEIEDIVLFPGSNIPLRLRDRNWVNYLGALIDDARGLYGHHQSSTEGMGEVRIVILPRFSNGRRRTHLRPRERGGGPTAVGPTETAPSAPTGRWRVDLIRRGVSGTSRMLTRRRRISSAQSTEHSGVAAAESHDEGGTQQNQLPSDQSSSDEDSEVFRPSDPPPAPDDPLSGRIGTMATITFTHEQTASYVNSGEPAEATSSSRVWQDRGGELVVTLLGTTRVRLIHAARGEKTDPDDRNQIPFYAVEELSDGIAALPPSWMMRPACNARCSAALKSSEAKNEEEDKNHSEPQTSNEVSGDNRAIRNLSIRSSIPEFAYRAVWSQTLSEKICNMIQDSDQFQGLRKILSLAAGLHLVEDIEKEEEDEDDTQESANGEMSSPALVHVQIEDASAFASWMASNMPLSVNDRLDLLEMTSTAQQLRYIIHTLEKKMQETVLRCKHCGAPISQMCHVFSVGGSEGTTGAYVNEHGVVHQTVTLRQVDNHAVVCIGGPETKDSWFPGYSWTISYCSVCSNHLGWKFRKVSKGNNDPEGRPKSFWGFSSITTDEHVSPRRISFHTRTALTALLRQG